MRIPLPPRLVSVAVAVATLPSAATLVRASADQTRGFSSGTKIDIPSAGVVVPMRDFGGRPAVDARINGQGPFLLIVDTGASGTVLSPDLIAEVAPGASASGGPVKLEELRVGEAVLWGLTVARIGLLGGGSGGGAPRGVLSAAAFPGALVVFDYPGRTIAIRPGALPVADNRRVFEYAATDVLPRVPVRIAGHDFSLHVDTGSPDAVTVPTRFATELPIEAPPVQRGIVRTVAGEFPMFSATLKGTMSIGEFPLDSSVINFSDLRPGPGPAPGNIGAQVLKQFVLTFDAKNRRLQFERPKTR